MTTNLMALEAVPGTLLKVTCDSAAEKFASAVPTADVVAVCGHLVSLIVTNKGLENTPLALLGNYVRTGLLKMQASASCTASASGEIFA